METELNEAQKRFCEEYIYDWNATRAYSIAYPKEKSNDTIRVNACRLLTNANVKTYIGELQKDIQRIAGISRLRIVKEYEKLAFSSIAHMHNTWVERKELEQLTDDQKACIQEIDTKVLKKNIGTREEPEIVDVEYIKIKLYDKKGALDSLSKMLGYNEPDKIDVTTKEAVLTKEERDQKIKELREKLNDK